MHLTWRWGSPDSQFARWLMMVSMAIAVLPVCLADLGGGGALLADRDVDALDLALGVTGLPVRALVDDGVDGDRRLAGLPGGPGRWWSPSGRPRRRCT